jgi:hypothetical protein
MDDSFVTYGGEDIEFAHRCLREGLKLACSLRAEAIHQEVGMNVKRFGHKVRSSSELGTPILKALAPEARLIRSIRASERGDQLNYKDFFLFYVSTVLVRFRFDVLLSWYLLRTDSIRFLYSSFFYRLYMLLELRRGAIKREGHTLRQSTRGAL